MRATLIVSAALCASVTIVACGSSSPGGGGGGGGTAGSGGSQGTAGNGGGGSTGTAGSGGTTGTGSGGGAGTAGSGGSTGTGGCTGTVCDGKCTATSTDASNCGFCGNVCGSFQACTAGVCTSSQTCPAAPSGASAGAVLSYTLENNDRAASGIPCATLQPTLDTSAADHCEYYAANVSSATCVADPHVEVSGCTDYVAAQFYTRETDAGYTGQPAFEDMAFDDNGTTSTQQFIDSVWHRIPILSPWVRDMGYGGATGCDTIDFGVGAATADTVTAVYPYPGQSGVPTSFNGTYEGPPPPEPPGGWPSGYPVTTYLKGAKTASVHTITVLGSTTPLDHQIISPGDADAMGLVTDEFILYTNAPMTAATHYHVHVEATGTSGSVTFDWVFTTM
jgi:hypothetical protein